MNPKAPAFPVAVEDPADVEYGMNLRTYIATACLQGMLSRSFGGEGNEPPDDVLATWAVGQADALIAELNKEAK